MKPREIAGRLLCAGRSFRWAIWSEGWTLGRLAGFILGLLGIAFFISFPLWASSHRESLVACGFTEGRIIQSDIRLSDHYVPRRRARHLVETGAGDHFLLTGPFEHFESGTRVEIAVRCNDQGVPVYHAAFRRRLTEPAPGS